MHALALDHWTSIPPSSWSKNVQMVAPSSAKMVPPGRARPLLLLLLHGSFLTRIDIVCYNYVVSHHNNYRMASHDARGTLNRAKSHCLAC